jgi:hypothetical protein
MLKPTTWKEWARLNETNREAYARWLQQDDETREATDPEDWCSRIVRSCPGCQQLYLVSPAWAMRCRCGFYEVDSDLDLNQGDIDGG